MIQQDIGDASDLWSVSTPVVIVCPVLAIISPAAILPLSFIISLTCRFAFVAWGSFEIDADLLMSLCGKTLNCLE